VPHFAKFITVIASLMAVFAAPISTAQVSPDVRAEVYSLTQQNDFNQALALLGAQDAVMRDSFSHKLLTAQVHSWAGNYAVAEQQLNTLQAQSPGNLDVKLSIANLNYYRGRHAKAEREFSEILAVNPNYTDAKTGLENARKARNASVKPSPETWRVDGNAGWSSFDKSDQKDWSFQSIRAEYSPNKVAYHGALSRYERFGKTDEAYEIGIANGQRGTWDWGASLTVTPKSDFLAASTISVRGGRVFTLDNGPTFHASLNYKSDDYSAGKVQTLSPQLDTYFDDGTLLSLRAITTRQKGESDQTGWIGSISRPINDTWSIRAGGAKAPEAIDGEVVQTTSRFGGLTYSVSEALDLHINVARDDREDVYVRKAISVGFTQTF